MPRRLDNGFLGTAKKPKAIAVRSHVYSNDPLSDRELIFRCESFGCSRKAVLFTCACCRIAWDRLKPQAARDIVSVAENFADGKSSLEDLEKAGSLQEFEAIFQSFDTDDFSGLQLSAREIDAVFATLTLSDPHQIDLYTVVTNLSRSVANDFFPRPGTGFAHTRVADTDEIECSRKTLLLHEFYDDLLMSIAFNPEWRDDTTIRIAGGMYESRNFSYMPILADALDDAGCDNQLILDHCRLNASHYRGCWLTDWILGFD